MEQEAADLLDAIDGIARPLGSWHSGSLDELRTNLRCFKDAHPGHCTNYPWVLDEQEDLL